MDVQQPQDPQNVPNQQPSVQAPVPAPTVPPPTGGLPVQPTPATQLTKKSPMLWWGIGAFFVVVLMVLGAYFLLPKNQIVIDDQVVGNSIHVRQLILTRPGILVIEHISVVQGVNSVAQTIFLEPDDYRDFDLPLHTDLITPLMPGDQLYGVIYKDIDGDEGLNQTIDKPMRDIFGRQTRAYFKLL